MPDVNGPASRGPADGSRPDAARPRSAADRSPLGPQPSCCPSSRDGGRRRRLTGPAPCASASARAVVMVAVLGARRSSRYILANQNLNGPAGCRSSARTTSSIAPASPPPPACCPARATRSRSPACASARSPACGWRTARRRDARHRARRGPRPPRRDAAAAAQDRAEGHDRRARPRHAGERPAAGGGRDARQRRDAPRRQLRGDPGQPRRRQPDVAAAARHRGGRALGDGGGTPGGTFRPLRAAVAPQRAGDPAGGPAAQEAAPADAQPVADRRRARLARPPARRSSTPTPPCSAASRTRTSASARRWSCCPARWPREPPRSGSSTRSARRCGPGCATCSPAPRRSARRCGRCARSSPGRRPLRDQLRPFAREAQPTARKLVPATRDLATRCRSSPSSPTCSTRCSTSSPTTRRGTRQSYLFYVPWAGHNTNSVLSPRTASARRGAGSCCSPAGRCSCSTSSPPRAGTRRCRRSCSCSTRRSTKRSAPEARRMIKTRPGPRRSSLMLLFALGSFAAMLFLWLAFGGVPLKPKAYRFDVVFPEATTLAEQAEVRISGVPVGKVVAVTGPGQRGARDDRDERPRAGRRGHAGDAADQDAARRDLRRADAGHPEQGHAGRGRDAASARSRRPSSSTRSCARSTAHAGGLPDVDAVAGAGDGRPRRRRQHRSASSPASSSTRPAAGHARRAVRRAETVARTGEVFDAISEREGDLRGLITDAERLFSATGARNEQLAAIFRELPRFERESRWLPADRARPGGHPVVRQLQPAADEMAPTFAARRALAGARRLLLPARRRRGASERGCPRSSACWASCRPCSTLPALAAQRQPDGRPPRRRTSARSPPSSPTRGGHARARLSPTRSPGAAPVHYLRTAQTLAPEALTFFPRTLGSTRERLPGPGGDRLAAGLPGSRRSCATATSRRRSRAPRRCSPLIQQYVFRTTGRDAARPGCTAQGPQPGFGTTFPQLRAEP